jgi:hypothetical protein
LNIKYKEKTKKVIIEKKKKINKIKWKATVNFCFTATQQCPKYVILVHMILIPMNHTLDATAVFCGTILTVKLKTGLVSQKSPKWLPGFAQQNAKMNTTKYPA